MRRGNNASFCYLKQVNIRNEVDKHQPHAEREENLEKRIKGGGRILKIIAESPQITESFGKREAEK